MKIKKFIMTHFQINSRSLKKIALFLRKSKDINPMEMSLDLSPLFSKEQTKWSNEICQIPSFLDLHGPKLTWLWGKPIDKWEITQFQCRVLKSLKNQRLRLHMGKFQMMRTLIILSDYQKNRGNIKIFQKLRFCKIVKGNCTASF